MNNLNTLIDGNKSNHYKLLTIVGNNQVKLNQIVEYLMKSGWEIHDVEEKVLEIAVSMPEEKLRLRIGAEIKKWVRELGNNIVLLNSNILYSIEMDKIGPFRAFKYCMRGEKEGILFLDAKLRGNLAVYSTPDRPDYLAIELSDVLFIDLEEVEV